MHLVNPTWTGGRAGVIKASLPPKSRILVSTGGGIDVDTSVGSWALDCEHFDIGISAQKSCICRGGLI